jgi:cystathionine beta-lyase
VTVKLRKMKHYNFDEIIRREKTNSIKYDQRKNVFGTEDVLPLWIADMDFKTPDFIIDAIKRRAAHEIYGYSFVPESFYVSVQSWLKKQHGWEVHREWILYCPGVVPSLVIAMLSCTQPGDAVVVQPPVYYPFFSVIRDNGRTIATNPLELRDGRLSINFDHLMECLDKSVKLLFLCSPHNPGGTVWRRDELERLGEICKKNGTIIVSDEIHSDLIFHGHKHIPTASISEEASQNTITLISPSKTFNLSGLTTSVAIIPDHDLRRRFQQTIQGLHWNIPNIFSIAAFESAYGQGEAWLKQLLAYLENNLNVLMDFFESEIKQIKVIKPEGTYLVWLDCRELGMNQDEIKAFMISRAKVGLNDGCMFGRGGEGFQRMNIACPLPVLLKALERIKHAVKNLYPASCFRRCQTERMLQSQFARRQN